MKAIILLSALSCFVFSYSASEIIGFGSNPGNLKMYVHIPKNLEANESIPVVLAMHGCSQNAAIIEEQSGWSDLADKYGFIVIYPEQKRINNPMGCFRWYDYEETETQEVESVFQMLDFVERNYNIDPERLFVYGVSAGGVMSIHTVVHRPEKFSAAACLAGGPYKIGEDDDATLMDLIFMDERTPEEWKERLPNYPAGTKFPKLILGHGNKDKLVNINCSFEIIDQFSTMYNTDVQEDSLILNFAGNDGIEKRIYNDSFDKECMAFYIFKDLGHALPVDPGTGNEQGGKEGMFAVDKNFFSTYYIAKDFGLIP